MAPRRSWAEKRAERLAKICKTTPRPEESESVVALEEAEERPRRRNKESSKSYRVPEIPTEVGTSDICSKQEAYAYARSLWGENVVLLDVDECNPETRCQVYVLGEYGGTTFLGQGRSWADAIDSVRLPAGAPWVH